MAPILIQLMTWLTEVSSSVAVVGEKTATEEDKYREPIGCVLPREKRDGCDRQAGLTAERKD